jgi:hypothetical protein
MSAPECVGPPVLIMRTPGDEESGGLGASLMIGRAPVIVSGKIASVWAWLDRHRFIVPLVGFLVASTALWTTLGLTGSVTPLKWPGLGLLALLFAVLVVPLLLGFPLRALLYCVSYGCDVGTRGAYLTVTAESTPPGEWRVHTIVPKEKDDGPGLAGSHSEPHGNEEAIDAIARWIKAQLADSPG